MDKSKEKITRKDAMSKIISKGTGTDKFFTVTEEEYQFIHWNWIIPSASIISWYDEGKVVTEYKVICPEYAELKSKRLIKLII